MAASAQAIVREAAQRAWMPPPTMSIAEWADENRVLGQDAPEPGRYRTSRTPFLRQPMECLSASHPARHIIVEKGVQMGFTTVALNWLGYSADQCPASFIITLPGEGIAKEWSNQRLTQLVESTPCLHGKILESKRNRSGNSMFLKRVAGTSVTWKLAWASSARKLRSTPAPNLISDEADEFEGDVEGEGNPLKLLDGRFANYSRGKHLIISTPTRTPSRIDAEFQNGDQRLYFLPCPFCGHFQALEFHALKKGPPVTYECCRCREAIPERFKTQMLMRGIWVATRDAPEIVKGGFEDPKVLAPILARMERATFVSFRLPVYYSPVGWYSWETLMSDWAKAQQSPPDLKAFINMKLGEPWVERGKAPDSDRLFDRHEGYPTGTVPKGGLLLTAVADVHPNRLEVEIKAWGRNRESWSVAYEVLEGDPLTPVPWDALAALILKGWPHAEGGLLPISACGIDTGHLPEPVYAFCRQPGFARLHHTARGDWVYTPHTVFPLKGGHSWQVAIEGVSDTDAAQKRGGLRIVTVGSPYLKLTVMGWLEMAHKRGEPFPPCYMHYPGYDTWVFEGLCAESVVTSADGKRRFVRAGRNEPLDLAAYNLAAAELCRIAYFKDSDWTELERRARLAPPTEDKSEVPKQAEPSRILQGRDTSNWFGDRRKNWLKR